MLNITQIPAPRVDFIDPRSGFMSREWYRFFVNLFMLTGNGSNTVSLTDLQVGPPTQETIIELDKKLESLYISPSPETSELSAQINEVRQELKTLMLSFDSLEIEKQIQGLSVTPYATQGEVVAVTATAPLSSSGGAFPNLTITQSGASTDGYLSSTDWNAFNSKQPAGTYVTSVSVASSNGLAGTSSGGATPTLTLSTSITGILKGNGTAISAASANVDYLAPSGPVTYTANFSVAATDVYVINNKSGSTCTVTLPAASTCTGRAITFQNYQAQTLVSASSNIIHVGGGAAGTAILNASVGDACTIVANGTNWVMMQYIPNNILLLE